MKLVFVSNYYNHHQRELCDALSVLVESFQFVETEAMPEERLRLGWAAGDKPTYVTHDTRGIRNADVIIAGSAPEKLMREAIKCGKTVFRYSERPLKCGAEPLKYLPRLIRWNYRNPRGKPIYLLAAGGYAAGDYAAFGLFKGRAYKWGYFPELYYYDDIRMLISQKNKKEILWAGRFVEQKHPNDAIKLVRRLKSNGYCFTLCMIGCGPLEDALKGAVVQSGLGDTVRFMGAMPPEAVRCCMERAGIFLFTSDRQDGWGAVLNEAMNSGCAVVTTREAGAAPFLIRPDENGLVYRCGDDDGLLNRVRRLLDFPQEQDRLGKAAYETIWGQWNGKTAAERFVKLAESILSGENEPDTFDCGPCSVASVIREDRYSL